jgi:translation initiation factor 5B
VIGKVTGIEKNLVAVTEAKVGDEVAVKFELAGSQQPVYGRAFDHNNLLVSRVSFIFLESIMLTFESQLTRQSIDVLKANFADVLTPADWKLVIKLKSHFEIS